MGPELALIVGWVAPNVLNKLKEMIIAYVEDQKYWQLGMKDELKRLEDALPKIQAVLEAIENGHFKNSYHQGLQAWMWQLRDAVDEAEDVLDELEYHELEEQLRKAKKNKLRNVVVPFQKFMKRAFQSDTVMKGLRESVKKLEKVATQVESFLHLVDKSATRRLEKQTELIKHRDTGSSVDTPTGVVLGRNKAKDKIIQLLLESSSMMSSSSGCNPSIVPIVGMGGIGKTTLAQYVYNDSRVEKYFDCRIWVCVSNVFDPTILTKKILENATGSPPAAENLATLQDILIKLLESRRYLLVLDDIWNDYDSSSWQKLFAALRSGKSGSMVLVTTRSEKVKDMIDGMTDLFRLEGLKEDEYWSLFQKCAFGKEDLGRHQRLLEIGLKIAKKLKGNPLAAKTIGALLKARLSDEYWAGILKNISSHLEKNSNDLIPILRLSYENLPGNLQSCFAYCSIFPEDYMFKKTELVSMWMGAGLVQECGDDTLEEEGERYFEELLQRSLFDFVHDEHDEGLITYDRRDIHRYKMHDLLHEMAASVSVGECFRISNRGSSVPVVLPPKTVRHLGVETDSIDVIKKIGELKHLRSLLLRYHVSKHQEAGKTLEEELRNGKRLRVLSLTVYEFSHEVSLEFLGDLVHLRYLDLFNAPIKASAKSLHKLYHLQTLFVSNPFFEEDILIDNLISLRHLATDGFMVPFVGKLTALQECYFVQSDSYNRLKELAGLSELRVLELLLDSGVEHGEEGYKAKLSEKQHLKWLSFYIGWRVSSNRDHILVERLLDCLKPPPNLKELEISRYWGTRSPVWMEDLSLSNLESLSLDGCVNWGQLPWFGRLPYLKSLKLARLSSVEELGTRFYVGDGSKGGGVFPQLKELEIDDLRAFTDWSEKCVLPRQWLPYLEILILKECSILRGLPCQLLRHSTTLQELAISRCYELQVVPEEGFRGLHCLRVLKLEECPKLVRPGLPLPSSLECFSVKCCNLSDESLSTCLGGLCSLSEVKIRDHQEGSLTSLPTVEVLRQLTSLRDLALEDLPNLTASGLWGLQVLSSLQTLKLDNLKGLSSIPPLLSTSITHLCIRRVPELKSLPPLPASMDTLEVYGCHDELLERLEGKECEDWHNIASIARVSID